MYRGYMFAHLNRDFTSVSATVGSSLLQEATLDNWLKGKICFRKLATSFSICCCSSFQPFHWKTRTIFFVVASRKKFHFI